MSISFGRKNQVPESKIPPDLLKGTVGPQTTALHPDCQLIAKPESRLLDLRSPEAFRSGFIPGSYHVPDLSCVLAARRMRLFEGRQVYLLADHLEQLQLCSEPHVFGESADIVGWFGPDAIDEWQKVNPELGSLEALDSNTLGGRLASSGTLILDILEPGDRRKLSHPTALRFPLDDLPIALEGLPVESPLCLVAATTGTASFAASLLWNFGFRTVSYLNGGYLVQFGGEM